jgi:hypothetical protein
MSQPGDVAELEADAGEGMPPAHGYQGDRGMTPSRKAAPLGLSIAVSREAGARGSTIARLTGQRLGWDVYDQELMELISQDEDARANIFDSLPPEAQAWVEGRLSEIGPLGDPHTARLARLMLELAARGEVVLIGRGAGLVLPRRTTLNVRVVAPLADRVAYMGQWMRLSAEEAAEKVKASDARRSEYIRTVFGSQPGGAHLYDLVLNSTSLGVEACAELIARAARSFWDRVKPEMA